MCFAISSAQLMLEKSCSYNCEVVIHVHICFNISCMYHIVFSALIQYI